MGKQFDAGNIPTGNIPTGNNNKTIEQIAKQFPSQNAQHPLISTIIEGNNKPFTIGNMPECLIEIFKNQAQEHKMSLREYLTYLLKMSGADVPDIRLLNPSRRIK